MIDQTFDTMVQHILEADDIFKPATQRDIATRKHEKWAKGRPFAFLEYVDNPAEVLEKGYGALKNMPYDKRKRSEIWVKYAEPEILIHVTTDEVIKELLKEDASMTESLNNFVDKDGTPEDWIKAFRKDTSTGYKGYHGYTGNMDPAYFWGDDFEYMQFYADDIEYIMIKTYGHPWTVYQGDYEGAVGDFWSAQDKGEWKSEAAYALGYNGDSNENGYEDLLKDIRTWYESDGAITAELPDPSKDPLQMRFPFAQDKE